MILQNNLADSRIDMCSRLNFAECTVIDSTKGQHASGELGQMMHAKAARFHSRKVKCLSTRSMNPEKFEVSN